VQIIIACVRGQTRNQAPCGAGRSVALLISSPEEIDELWKVVKLARREYGLL